MKRWSEIRNGKLSQEAQERSDKWVDEEITRLSLRELREAAGKTQEEVAALLDATQSELSKIERRADHRLSTLRRFVEALGGELHLVASIGGKQIVLSPPMESMLGSVPSEPLPRSTR